MLEAISSVLSGGLIGGIFRLVPEILKYFDSKNDRAHELRMQELEYKFQELRGKQAIGGIHAQGQIEWNQGALNALGTAINAQAQKSGVKWVDAFSSLMRPLITFQWVVLLYPGVIVATFLLYIEAGRPPLEAIVAVFGPDEKALVAGILNFWFLGRVFDRVKVRHG